MMPSYKIVYILVTILFSINLLAIEVNMGVGQYMTGATGKLVYTKDFGKTLSPK